MKGVQRPVILRVSLRRVPLMGDQAVQRSWQDHAEGDVQVGGLRECCYGDVHRCPERSRQAGARQWNAVSPSGSMW